MQPNPLLVTKLHIPSVRPTLVSRPHLVKRLNEDLWQNGEFARKLTLISASAGFGKTTLLSEWINHPPDPNSPPLRYAWLSLDENDNEPYRFLTYLVAALQTYNDSIGQHVAGALQTPQPPPVEVVITSLINDLAAVSDQVILVLDDYHLIEALPVHQALTFLLDHLPAQLHLVIATREDPLLPLARLRARGQLNELRVADLRFTLTEAVEFLNQVMGLPLSQDDIAAVEMRTEGWIAGLHLVALALQRVSSAQVQDDIAGFIHSFTGSHRFVLDYLVEEVLQQQPNSIQTFLLQTSILDRLTAPLCDALTGRDDGQATLDYLERANLFLIPLDNERRWYRYHHLFAGFLRQRLHQNPLPFPPAPAGERVTALHIRASAWYERNGFYLEAFDHATTAGDVDHAERLIAEDGFPRHLRGAVGSILTWLASLPRAVLDERPSLWASYAGMLLVNGQTTGVEEILLAAERSLAAADPIEPDSHLVETLNDQTRNLLGRIAVAWATLSLTRYQVEAMITHSRRALTYLAPDNLSYRTTANWTLGYAYQIQGNRAAATQAFTQAIQLSRASGDVFANLLATIGLGEMQESENQLYLAAETYRHALDIAGDQPLQYMYGAHLGLARIHYQWNNLDAAQKYGQQSLQLAQQYDKVIDRFIICEIFLARLKLTRGNVNDAATALDGVARAVRRRNFVHRLPEVAAAQVPILLRQGNLAKAATLAEKYNLPITKARVHLARGNPVAALAALAPWHQQIEAQGWADEVLKVRVLQAVALYAQGEQAQAIHLVNEALAMAEPGGFIRIFLDEGPPMTRLLAEAAAQEIMPDYIEKLLSAFETEDSAIPTDRQTDPTKHVESPPDQPLVEPLSERELQILHLIAQGLTNREISERLFIALSTVKGHNSSIYGKLAVHRRTEAVARAQELGLL